jgi:hypothetical protein
MVHEMVEDSDIDDNESLNLKWSSKLKFSVSQLN